MIDLLQVYACSRCGHILSDQVEHIEVIDTDNDDVWKEALCRKCRGYARPILDDGIPVYRQVSHERFLFSTGYYDDRTGGAA